MKSNEEYTVIGLMSGTSLDGVDIACCKFSNIDDKWSFEIIRAETVPYSTDWKKVLGNLEKESALYFQQIHMEYGFYLGGLVNDFFKRYGLRPDFVSSHGHTIFHTDVDCLLLNRQVKKLTVQVGAGSAMAAQCHLPVVCDFRTLDAALGGQGAPLVPIGDELLFSEYDYCMNLGGFANVSYRQEGKRVAFDICPVNIVMNRICAALGKEYDDGGRLAATGKINEVLLEELNRLPFYRLPPHRPKSLGKEWVVENIYPLLENYPVSANDVLRTMVEHIALQISKTLNSGENKKIIATGGGVYNHFLMECIKEKTKHSLIIPEKNIIEFKEALIFAFLGVLRMRKQVNCLQSVTGSAMDNSGGAVYYAQ